MVALLGLLLFLLFSSNECSHDKNIVTGKVFPAGITVPIRGVAVQIKGDQSSSVHSDGSGFFKIEVSSFPVKLLFSKEPYQTQVITVKKPSDIVVYMTAGK